MDDGDRHALSGAKTVSFGVRIALPAIAASSACLTLLLQSEIPMVAGASAGATACCLDLARRNRHRLWAIVGIVSVLMLSTSLSPEISFWLGAQRVGETIIGVNFVLISLLACCGIWLGCRPFLSWSPSRTPARVFGTGVVSAISGLMILDDSIGTTRLEVAPPLAIGLMIGGTGLMAGSLLVLFRRLRAAGRMVEVLLATGIIGHMAIHSTAILRGTPVDARFGQLLLMSIVAFTALRPDAIMLGTPIGQHTRVLQNRLWPVVIAVGLAVIASWLVRSDAPELLSGVSLMFAAVTAAFAARELGASNKPVSFPFTPRDRALQKLPNELLRGRLALNGQQVLRVSDGAFVAVETTPTWVGTKRFGRITRPSMPMAEAAEIAGLEAEFNHCTLEVTAALLPVVLDRLEGDEPWVSVPILGAATDLPSSDHAAMLDGLVLRVSGPIDPEDTETLDRWRDRGAWLHLEEADLKRSSGLTPEIVSTETVRRDAKRRLPLTSMPLLREDTATPSLRALRRDGVFFVTVNSDNPSKLIELVSRVDPPDENEAVLGASPLD